MVPTDSNDGSNCCDDEPQTVEDCLQALNQSILSSKQRDGTGAAPVAARLQYQQRLQSFQSSTYFAKPLRLSPILAARFGWKNVEKDVLQCDACQAALAVILHPHLSKAATDKLIGWYETQLAEAHREACRFRHTARNYFGPRTIDKNNMPLLWASVLPREEVELLEPVRPPIPLLQKLVREVLHATLADNNERQLKTFTASLPPNILWYPQKVTENESSSVSLVKRLAERVLPISTDQGETFNESNLEEALLLALFGWRQRRQENTSGNSAASAASDATSWSLFCPLCLASMPMAEETKDGQETRDQDADRAAKRVRTGNPTRTPWNAHRFYCPYVAGWPQPGCIAVDGGDVKNNNNNNNHQPVWQALADKILALDSEAEANEESAEAPPPPATIDTLLQFHNMLTQGVATKERHSTKH